MDVHRPHWCACISCAYVRVRVCLHVRMCMCVRIHACIHACIYAHDWSDPDARGETLNKTCELEDPKAVLLKFSQRKLDKSKTLNPKNQARREFAQHFVSFYTARETKSTRNPKVVLCKRASESSLLRRLSP